ncbi:MAG: hypothetical protein JRE81_03120 [Deltaproteobacteria bacterium]|nr:hypothetical protein [Deltaproteobacteria bacterium]
MSLRRLACFWVLVLGIAGCDQLGNPEQFATGPTAWKDQRGHLVTTTRSFKDEKTIRRLLAQGIEDLDYADPAIGPSETLTVVVVVPRALRPTRGLGLKLVTTFKLRGRPPMTRAWSVRRDSRRWSAAFALPEPPIGAISAVAP